MATWKTGKVWTLIWQTEMFFMELASACTRMNRQKPLVIILDVQYGYETHAELMNFTIIICFIVKNIRSSFWRCAYNT
jgi:hypothetical protein